MSIIKRLYRTVFFFNTENNIDCDFYIIWKELSSGSSVKSNFWTPSYIYSLVHKWHNCATDYFTMRNYPSYYCSNTTIFFGEKHADLPVLLCQKSDEYFITPDWFDHIDNNANAIAFVYQGTDMLDTTIWANKFKAWISIGNKFDFLTGFPEFETLRKEIFRSIIKSCYSKKPLPEIRDDILMIFQLSINSLAKNFLHKNEETVENAVVFIQLLRLNMANIHCYVRESQ